MDKEHIIDEIKRTAEANGGEPLGTARFQTQTGISRSDWYGKYWSRWGDALKEAGYLPNEFKRAYEDEWVIEKLIAFIREIGHYPVAAELRMKARNETDFPSHNVFGRVGKKTELAAKVVEYCKKREGFDDVIAICEPIATAVNPETKSEKLEPSEIGYVYLMKSGRYYKVGRSKAPGRREYELAIQLPEKVTTVHTIKTDDPVGIEAYWHNRFQDRRNNGEWFELSTKDVQAFKRRKFM